MTKLFSLALLPLLSVAARAQAPVADSSRVAAVEQSDRAFLSNLERREAPAPVLPPAPVVAAPAPQTTVTASATTLPAPKVTSTHRTVAKAVPTRHVASVNAASAKPKATSIVAASRQRSTPERSANRSRNYADGPVFRGVHVIDPPETVARIERRSGLSFRPIEIRRPIVVRKVTTTTVISRERDDDDNRDEDEKDD